MRACVEKWTSWAGTSHYFYSLSNVRKTNRNLCTTLPTLDDAISCIHDLAQNEPTVITFTKRNENEIQEDDDDGDYVPYREEGIKENGSNHPDDDSTINNEDD